MSVRTFAVNTYLGLYRDARRMTPQVALRELVVNAIEAKATAIEVVLSDDGMRVRDDGSGMGYADLKRHFTSFHSSGKKLGSDANFGIGAKMAFMAFDADRMTISSCGPRGSVHMVEFGREIDSTSPNGGYNHGPVEQNGDVVREGTVPSGWKTEVFVGFRGFSGSQVLKALNGRLQKVPCTLTVSDQKVSSGAPPVTGYMDCLRRASSAFYSYELKSCTLSWGEKGSSKQHQAVLENEWDGPTLAFAHRDEVYDTKVGRSAAKWLDRAGICVGQSGLFVVVEPKGNKLAWDNSRTDVSGVDCEAIQEEIFEWIDSRRLPELTQYMEVIEAQMESLDEVLSKGLEEGLPRLAQLLGITNIPGGRKSALAGTTSSRAAALASSGHAERGPTKPRRRTGIPGVKVAESSEITGGDAVIYSQTRHELTFYLGHSRFSQYLSDATSRKQKEKVRRMICLELTSKFMLWRHANPDGDVEQSTLDSFADTLVSTILSKQLTPSQVGKLLAGT
jgi:hypothetical protein